MRRRTRERTARRHERRLAQSKTRARSCRTDFPRAHRYEQVDSSSNVVASRVTNRRLSRSAGLRPSASCRAALNANRRRRRRRRLRCRPHSAAVCLLRGQAICRSRRRAHAMRRVIARQNVFCESCCRLIPIIARAQKTRIIWSRRLSAHDGGGRLRSSTDRIGEATRHQMHCQSPVGRGVSFMPPPYTQATPSHSKKLVETVINIRAQRAPITIRGRLGRPTAKSEKTK